MFRFLVVVIVEPSYGFKPDGMGQLHMASAVKKIIWTKILFWNQYKYKYAHKWIKT